MTCVTEINHFAHNFNFLPYDFLYGLWYIFSLHLDGRFHFPLSPVQAAMGRVSWSYLTPHAGAEEG